MTKEWLRFTSIICLTLLAFSMIIISTIDKSITPIEVWGTISLCVGGIIGTHILDKKNDKKIN